MSTPRELAAMTSELHGRAMDVDEDAQQFADRLTRAHSEQLRLSAEDAWTITSFAKWLRRNGASIVRQADHIEDELEQLWDEQRPGERREAHDAG